MARKKLSPQNIAIFAGPSPATAVHTTSNINELYGIQSFSFDLNDSKEDVNTFGKKSSVSRIAADPSTITFDLSYLVSNLDNENSIGFSIGGVSGAFANILDGSKDERNFFVMVAPEGRDAIGSNPATTPCLGFGNSTLSSYNFSAAVGSYPTCSLSFEAIDTEYYSDSDSEILPAINVSTGAIATGTFTLPTASGNFGQRDPVLRPGDITVNLSGASGIFHSLPTACVQSVDFGVDLARENQLCLGSKFRTQSSIADAIPLTLSLEFLAKDMVADRFSSFVCQTGEYRAIIGIKRPSCNNSGQNAVTFDLKGLRWESQNQDFSLGAQSTVTINFQGTIGGVKDSLKGLFVSGIVNNSSGESLITVANEAARYALTGISPGQLVTQTDNSTTYRLLAPSTAQGGVAVLGGSQDGIYIINGEDNLKPRYCLLGQDSVELYVFLWGGGRWGITDDQGDELYYSLSDVATPDLATDWKNSSDDSPAGITVTSVTEGELNAGVTVSGAGSIEANKVFSKRGPFNGRQFYNTLGESDSTDVSSIRHDSGYWSLTNGAADGLYDAESSASLPWDITGWFENTGTLPAPNLVQNDIAAPANWEEVT